MADPGLGCVVDTLHIAHRVLREDGVAVQVADVREPDVRHPQTLSDHGERVVLLVDHPAPHDLLKAQDVRLLALDHLDDGLERRDLAGVKSLVDVVGHEPERDRRLLGRLRGGRVEERVERSSDRDQRGSQRERGAEASRRDRHHERGERDGRERRVHRGLVCPEGVEAERHPDEDHPAERQRDDDLRGRARGTQRAAEEGGGGEHDARGEDPRADQRRDRQVEPEQHATEHDCRRGDRAARRIAHQRERARRDPQPNDELAGLRRACLLGIQAEPAGDRGLRAVRSPGLRDEHHARRHEQPDDSTEIGRCPLAVRAKRDESCGAEDDHGTCDHDHGHGPREVDDRNSAEDRAETQVTGERDRKSPRQWRRRVGGARTVEEGHPPEPSRERDDRQREVDPIAPRCRQEQRRGGEEQTRDAERPTRAEPPRNDQREERRREDGHGHDREIRVRRAEERQLER